MRFVFVFLFWVQSGLYGTSIFVIGDSHVRAFEGLDDCFVHWLGPITMHRIGRDGLDLQRLGVSDGTTVVYVFGEIDVRCHIGRQRDLLQRDEAEILHTLATHYLQTIAENQARFQNLKSIVYNVIPPTDTIYNPDYPTYGSLADRVRIARHLNDLLRSLCPRFGFSFLEVYDAYCDHQGALRFEISDGNVHIHPIYQAPIQQQLAKILCE